MQPALGKDASKQFLIFSPPLILTLHLKRFHQTLAGPKKVTRHVVFPLELDLAPFCSATALALPNLAPGQNKVGTVRFVRVSDGVAVRIRDPVLFDPWIRGEFFRIPDPKPFFVAFQKLQNFHIL